jgi:O-antigen ligase
MAVLSALIFVSPWLSQWMFHHWAPLLAESGNYEIRQAYMTDRMEIWDYISRFALNSPWHGYGIDVTRAVHAFDTRQIYHKGVTVPHPHNFSLQLWIEFGVIGAVFGAATLSFIVSAIGRLSSAGQRIALPVLIATIAVAAITYSIWQGWWIGTLFFVFAMCRLAAGVTERMALPARIGRECPDAVTRALIAPRL